MKPCIGVHSPTVLVELFEVGLKRAPIAAEVCEDLPFGDPSLGQSETKDGSPSTADQLLPGDSLPKPGDEMLPAGLGESVHAAGPRLDRPVQLSCQQAALAEAAQCGVDRPGTGAEVRQRRRGEDLMDVVAGCRGDPDQAQDSVLESCWMFLSHPLYNDA